MLICAHVLKQISNTLKERKRKKERGGGEEEKEKVREWAEKDTSIHVYLFANNIQMYTEIHPFIQCSNKSRKRYN